MNTLNVKRCNKMKAYEVCIKEKEHKLDVSMKDTELESTKALGNHLVIKEANILDELQVKETPLSHIKQKINHLSSNMIEDNKKKR